MFWKGVASGEKKFQLILEQQLDTVFSRWLKHQFQSTDARNPRILPGWAVKGSVPKQLISSLLKPHELPQSTLENIYEAHLCLCDPQRGCDLWVVCPPKLLQNFVEMSPLER